jgi:PilZ domain-containing protein
MSLPWEGALLWGRLYNLGLGGCNLETVSPLEHGTRAEIVLCVNTWSMRAIAQVRAVRERSGIGVEFVRMSAGAYRTLADLIEELERFRAVVRVPRAAARDDGVQRAVKSLCRPTPGRSIPVVGVVVRALPGEATAALQRRLRSWDLLRMDSSLDIFV